MDEKMKIPDGVLPADEEVCDETLFELSDGKGDEDNE